jgi:antitoxin HicB
MRYPVTLTRDDNHTFMVTFPDVPEAITYGDTREEALARGPDALLTIFDAFMKDRRDIPAPSSTKGLAIDLPAFETAKILLYQGMRVNGVNKTELAKRLNWHLPQVDRVLDVRHGSQFEQIEAAFGALGKRLTVTVEDLPDARARLSGGKAPTRSAALRRRRPTARRASSR